MKTMTIGDSWSSAIEADTGNDAGWPDMMQIDHRQAISGSTAAEWAGNKEGRLDKAIETDADVLILSLLGNDFRRAIQDGSISIAEITACFQDMRKVVRAAKKKRTIVILYADPFCGSNQLAALGVEIINMTIIQACIDIDVDSNYS